MNDFKDTNLKLADYDHRTSIIEQCERNLADLRAKHSEETRIDFGVADGDRLTILSMVNFLRAMGEPMSKVKQSKTKRSGNGTKLKRPKRKPRIRARAK